MFWGAPRLGKEGTMATQSGSYDLYPGWALRAAGRRAESNTGRTIRKVRRAGG